MAQREDLAAPGSAGLELVAGVAYLRPEDAMVEAMLRGWQAQQVSRRLREDSIEAREQLVRRFLAFTNDYPWQWTATQVDEWCAWLVTERHLAASTISIEAPDVVGLGELPAPADDSALNLLALDGKRQAARLGPRARAGDLLDRLRHCDAPRGHSAQRRQVPIQLRAHYFRHESAAG